MLARTCIGFNNRKISVFADEITTFLIECEKISLDSIPAITDALDDIGDLVINSNCKNADDLKRYLKLLKLIGLSMKGCLFEEPL